MQDSKRMRHVKKLCWTLGLTIAGLMLPHDVFAQIDTLNLNTDELFSLARTKAFAGQREEARGLCRIILTRNPSYLDARILLGRSYAWDKRWDEARTELRRAVEAEPTYKDALLASIDVELWDEKYAQAIDIANIALSSNPSDVDYLLRKVRALIGFGRNSDALFLLKKVEALNPSLTEISTLRNGIEGKSMNNDVGINYATDRFSETYDPMHYGYLQLSRRTPYGTMFGRVNYSSRFASQGVQVEGDLYPRIADGVYAYINYGFSNSDLFPKHRGGAEIYTKLTSSYEGSVGLRYLYFGPTSSVTIVTGSLALYFGNYWLSLRPYLIPGDAGLSKSANLTVRRYLKDAENYLSLRIGAGFSADERALQSNTGFQGQTEVFHLQSQTIGIGWQQSFGAHYLSNATFDVTNQELGVSPGRYVLMYSFSIGVRVRF
jgi:YaiO family outer membrane protein